MRYVYIIFIGLTFHIASCTHTKSYVSSGEVDSLSSVFSPEAHKEFNNLQQKVKDSLNAIAPESLPLDSAAIVNQSKILLQKEVDVSPDLKARLNQIKLDSSLYDQAAEHGLKEAQAFLHEEYGLNPTELPSSIDSTTYQQAKEKAQTEAEAYLKNHARTEIELDSLSKEQLLVQSGELLQNKLEESDYFENLQKTLNDQQQILDAQNELIEAQKTRLEGYMNQKALKEKMTNATKDFLQEHTQKIQSVQSEMSELKQVYTTVPNSNDLSTAIKETSLKEESIGKRLVLGGNFNIGQVDPFGMDLSPLIGYRFNELFSAGITGTYRVQFDRDKLNLQQGGETIYGYSFFIAHQVYRNFFGYLEGENKAVSIQGEEGRSVNWTKGLLFGIGRKLRISKSAEIQILILYNFLYNNEDQMYNSPLIIKTGILF